MPLHQKAQAFTKSRLFTGVRSFDQLEKRIAEVPEIKGKGYELLNVSFE
jgi:hypothetical protein